MSSILLLFSVIGAALFVALVSFGVLAWQIESTREACRREEKDGPRICADERG